MQQDQNEQEELSIAWCIRYRTTAVGSKSNWALIYAFLEEWRPVVAGSAANITSEFKLILLIPTFMQAGV